MKLSEQVLKQDSGRHYVVLEGENWKKVSAAFKTNRPSDITDILAVLADEIKKNGKATVEV